MGDVGDGRMEIMQINNGLMKNNIAQIGLNDNT